MARLAQALLERAESYSHRYLDVVDALEAQRRSGRILEQMTGCGTSVGANAWETDEAVSRADFCRGIGVILKELNESRYWLRLAWKREWLPTKRLEPLEREAVELRKIFGSMLARSKRKR
jgi:four helix bundle protein